MAQSAIESVRAREKERGKGNLSQFFFHLFISSFKYFRDHQVRIINSKNKQ